MSGHLVFPPPVVPQQAVGLRAHEVVVVAGGLDDRDLARPDHLERVGQVQVGFGHAMRMPATLQGGDAE